MKPTIVTELGLNPRNSNILIVKIFWNRLKSFSHF